MEAINKKFELIGNEYIESNYPQYSGHTFTNNGQNYKNILTSFVPEFGAKKWIFTYSLFVQNNLDNTWSFVRNYQIIADDKTYRDENGNLFFDSGDNEDENNAFLYSNGNIVRQEGDYIEYEKIKTLKEGLTVSEWEQFWYGVLDMICRPELQNSIIAQSLYGITSMV